MAFYAVELQGIPVAVLRGDTLEDATDLVWDSHQTDALRQVEHEGQILWTDNVEPVLVRANLDQVGMWAVTFEASVMRGGIDLEQAVAGCSYSAKRPTTWHRIGVARAQRNRRGGREG